MNWYLQALKKYAVFSGRARRKEYWYFTLINLLIIFALVIVDLIAGTFNQQYNLGLFTTIYYLAIIIPSFAVLVRRLHDGGRSGWWILLGLIPLIGPIVLFIFCMFDSDHGKNQYGTRPK